MRISLKIDSGSTHFTCTLGVKKESGLATNKAFSGGEVAALTVSAKTKPLQC